MKRIAIIGAGFAALTAARKLRCRDARAEITLIAPDAEFVYLRSLRRDRDSANPVSAKN